MAKRTPNLWRNVWNNFVHSLTIKEPVGNLKGQDLYGNKYYEIPADPSVGKRKASRWFVPSNKDAFDSEKPAEWMAWLRIQRIEPPTVEEIMRNKAIADLKKINSAILEEQAAKERIEAGREGPTQDIKGKYSFPLHSQIKTPTDDEKK